MGSNNTQNPIGRGLKDHTYLCSSIHMTTPRQVINNAGFAGRRGGGGDGKTRSWRRSDYLFHDHLKVRRRGSSTIKISILNK